MKLPILALALTFLFLNCQTEKVITYEEGLSICDQLIEEKKKEHPLGFGFVKAECIKGALMPEFETKTIDGRIISNENLKGKISIINFWFITCPPCIAKIPGLNEIVEKYGREDLNYIAIGRDKKSDIIEFLDQHPWKFEHISGDESLIDEVFKLRWGYPTTFVLNEKTEIISAFSGGQADSTAIEEIQKKLIPIIDKELGLN